MASLLDFLNANGGSGLLGGFGNGSFYNPQDEAEAARTAAATHLARLMRGSGQQFAGLTGGGGANMGATGPAIGQADPFNFVMPGQTAIGGSPQAQPPPPMPPPSAVGPPPGAMPVSLPITSPPPNAIPGAAPAATAPAAAAAPLNFGQKFNNYIDNNRATLMALGGGIAQHGMGGFATAAPVMAQERQFQQQQQNQALTAQAIHQGLISKGHNPKEAAAIAMAAAGNPAVAAAVLPELFSNKPSGEMFGVPYKLEAGKLKFLLPEGGTSGTTLQDVIKFGQGVAAQGAAAKEGATTTAKAQAEASQALPDVLASSDATLKEIEAVRNHESKGAMTGPVLGALPTGFTKSQNDYIARVEQLKGMATQMAIQANKGGGMRLTNTEVQSLQKVAARLDRRGDIDSALTDFANVVKGARERAGIKAGQGPTPAPAAPATNGGWSVTRVD